MKRETLKLITKAAAITAIGIALSACGNSTPAYTVGVDTAGKYYNVYPDKGQDPYLKPKPTYWYDPAIEAGLSLASGDTYKSIKQLFKGE